MTAATSKSPLATVIDEGHCRGFLLRRGPTGVEAFTADQVSIGVFADEAAAVAAIFKSGAVRS